MDLPLRMSREYWSPRKRDTGCVTSRGQGLTLRGFSNVQAMPPSAWKWCLILRLKATSRCGLGLDTGVVSRRMWMRSPGEDVEVRGDRLGVRARFRPQLPKLTPESILVASYSWTRIHKLHSYRTNSPVSFQRHHGHSTPQDQSVYPVDDSYPVLMGDTGDVEVVTVVHRSQGMQGLGSAIPRKPLSLCLV